MLPIVFIEWDDAVLRSGLNDTGLIAHKPVRLHSVGFLLQSDKKGISFATDYDPDSETYREQSFIPRGCVVRQKTYS